MTLKMHIITSLGVSSAVYLFFNSLSAAIASFLSGVLIDLDHWFDYFVQYRRIDIKHFFEVFQPSPLLERNYVLLHSVEAVIILWFLVYKFELGLFWIAIFIGLTQHVVLDYTYNNAHITPYFYFIFVRYARGFKKELLIKKGIK